MMIGSECAAPDTDKCLGLLTSFVRALEGKQAVCSLFYGKILYFEDRLSGRSIRICPIL